MVEYTDIKSRKMRQFLKWLVRNKGIEIKYGGRHTKITCIHNGKSYPLPLSHKLINRHIVKDFRGKLIEWGVITAEDFDERLK